MITMIYWENIAFHIYLWIWAHGYDSTCIAILSDLGFKRCKGSNRLSLVRLSTTSPAPSTFPTSKLPTIAAATQELAPAPFPTTDGTIKSGSSQEYQICISISSVEYIREDVLLEIENMDTGDIKKIKILKSGSLQNNTCQSITAVKKPHFKILGNNDSVSNNFTVLFSNYNLFRFR